MMSYAKHKLRYISFLVAVAFCASEVAYAAPVATTMPTAITRIALANYVHNPSQLDIPFKNVILKEIHEGTSGKLIIHIQDAHANLSGQKNLAKALDYFMTRYDLELVLVEGSSGEATMHDLRKLGPLAEWKIIARRFLLDGVISGEEFLNLTTEHPMRIMGVEYEDLYDDSIRAYAALVDRRKEVLHYLYRAKTAVGRLKHRLYPEKLLEYESIRNKDESIGYHLGPGFTELLELAAASGAGMDGFPEVKKLERLRMSEGSIDFEKANDEQKKLLQELAGRGAESEVKKYTQASRELKNVQISQYMLMRQLLNLARDRAINLAAYPELLVYERYLREFADLELHTLLNELELLEDVVYDRVLEDAEAKKIRAIDRFLGLLGNAYKLQMSSKDYALYEFNEEDFPTESWLAFMNQKLGQLGFFESMVPYKPYLESARGHLDKFYTLVGKRDRAFVENAKRIMVAQNAKAAVLIAGGYHTAHLTELLKKEDASYIVLTPVVSEATDHEKYERLLLAHLREQEGRLQSKGADEAFKADNIGRTKMPRGLRIKDFRHRVAVSLKEQADVRDFLAKRLGNQLTRGVMGAIAGTGDMAGGRPPVELILPVVQQGTDEEEEGPEVSQVTVPFLPARARWYERLFGNAKRDMPKEDRVTAPEVYKARYLYTGIPTPKGYPDLLGEEAAPAETGRRRPPGIARDEETFLPSPEDIHGPYMRRFLDTAGDPSLGLPTRKIGMAEVGNEDLVPVLSAGRTAGIVDAILPLGIANTDMFIAPRILERTASDPTLTVGLLSTGELTALMAGRALGTTQPVLPGTPVALPEADEDTFAAWQWKIRSAANTLIRAVAAQSLYGRRHALPVVDFSRFVGSPEILSYVIDVVNRVNATFEKRGIHVLTEGAFYGDDQVMRQIGSDELLAREAVRAQVLQVRQAIEDAGLVLYDHIQDDRPRDVMQRDEAKRILDLLLNRADVLGQERYMLDAAAVYSQPAKVQGGRVLMPLIELSYLIQVALSALDTENPDENLIQGVRMAWSVLTRAEAPTRDEIIAYAEGRITLKKAARFVFKALGSRLADLAQRIKNLRNILVAA